MSHKRIVVLGTGDYLKTSLISLILGKDVFTYRNPPMTPETYDNHSYHVTFTPDLYTASSDIREFFSSGQQPDMCLLVVGDGVSAEEVWQQIEQLHKTTGKPQEDFLVVLPLGCEAKDTYPTSCSLGELFNQLALDRPVKPMNISMRSEDLAEPNRKVYKEETRSQRDPVQEPSKSSWDFFNLFPKSKPHSGTPSDTKVNLVLLGMTGTGKSASGNTILGRREFASKASSTSVTMECQAAETQINGTVLRVIDTPDIFEDAIPSSVRKQHVTRSRELSQLGPCVFLLVLHVSRFTDGERNILYKLEKAFGKKAKDQTVILFTRGGDLQCSNMTLKGFLGTCQRELQEIVNQCGRRVILFENQNTNQQQVSELLDMVWRMINQWQNQ